MLYTGCHAIGTGYISNLAINRKKKTVKGKVKWYDSVYFSMSSFFS